MLLASIDWGCAVQITAAINIGDQNFVVTEAQTLYVYISCLLPVCPLLLLALLTSTYAAGSM